jgi:hypothetical protein
MRLRCQGDMDRSTRFEARKQLGLLRKEIREREKLAVKGVMEQASCTACCTRNERSAQARVVLCTNTGASDKMIAGTVFDTVVSQCFAALAGCQRRSARCLAGDRRVCAKPRGRLLDPAAQGQEVHPGRCALVAFPPMSADGRAPSPPPPPPRRRPQAASAHDQVEGTADASQICMARGWLRPTCVPRARADSGGRCKGAGHHALRPHRRALRRQGA